MKLFFYSAILLYLSSVSGLFAQEAQVVYQSETLKIEQISPHTFVHVSYLSTQDFGKVACNGMLVIHEREAMVFDTPTDAETSLELISWLENVQKVKVSGVVATHFHDDCLGGLDAFHSRGIPSFGTFKTISLAKSEGNQIPQNGFETELKQKVGGLEVQSTFLGEGHTRDNVVTYVPSEQVLFGGCLIKEVGATVGFLGDPNTSAWSATVTQVKTTFPKVKTVIPGHGKVGSSELLDYTIRLFEGK